ncbi:ABC-2 family transporter protein [Candidatus Gottesmanbacteria bacterium]|nr:ABC-2 family transporter protein [Candidatus Gottesmanbacteria bacterium]
MLQYRSTNVVWFLISFYHPLILLLFWSIMYKEHGEVLTGWSLPSIASYYIFLIAASSLLVVHIEEDAYEDIQRGDLSIYLMKPFSYFWIKFMSELPWRLLQGFYGFVAIVLLITIFGIILNMSLSLSSILLFVVIAILGYFVSFMFKMLLLLAAFWMTDTSALRNLVEIILLIGMGFVVPIQFLPDTIRQIAITLPFAYMVYYPVIVLTSRLSSAEYLRIISMQLLWIGSFALIYRWMWVNGIKKFSAVGR